MSKHEFYQVDPKSTLADKTGRYPRNFVNFTPLLKPIEWADKLSRALRDRPAPSIGTSMLDAFDKPGPLPERWGTSAELEVIRKNIRLFSQNVDTNVGVSPIGRFLIKTIMAGHLQNRSETIAYYEKNRAFIESRGKYENPILVTGFPRTGTTLLQRLLSEDPNARSPYTYEVEKSTPPLRSADDPLKDPRIETSVATMGTLKKLAPGFIEKVGESHVWSALEKEESMVYMAFHCGLNIMNAAGAGRSFLRSMLQPDVADAVMKYERNFFTMLDAYAPPKSHWTNKSPVYAPYFGKIFEHFPKARVVVTHRHPGKNMASCCRLFESWLIPFDVDGSFDKIGMADILTDAFGVLYDAPLKYREAHPEREAQIVDCLYHELFRDPIAMVKSIYKKFDLEYSQVFEDRMKVYLDNNKQGKYGRHRYTNEEYGIDRDKLYQDHRAYFDKYGYGVHPEGHD